MFIRTDRPAYLVPGLLLGLIFLAFSFGCGLLEEQKTEDEGGDKALTLGGWATEVVSVEYGEDAGHGQEKMPGIVLGPSDGSGSGSQSTHVVSLGEGGAITLAFDQNRCVLDLGGDDLAVMENAFYINGDPNNRFIEAAWVAVSQDGVNFIEFPASVNTQIESTGNPQRYSGFAGIEPVYPGSDPDEVGGDRFDLAEVGLEWIRYVRITDTGGDPEDAGDAMPPGSKMSGFDLDAIGAIHLGEGDECE